MDAFAVGSVGCHVANHVASVFQIVNARCAFSGCPVLEDGAHPFAVRIEYDAASVGLSVFPFAGIAVSLAIDFYTHSGASVQAPFAGIFPR